MNNNLYTSRSERQIKRRRNERFLFSLIAVAVLFVLMLVFFIFKGDNGAKVANKDKVEPNESTELTETDDSHTDSDEELATESNLSQVTSDDSSDDITIQSIESTDENVIEAFVGNWPPIGTSQEEPHTTKYEEDSQDRIEIRQAVLNVTRINKDNLTEHWIGNGGEQKVIATVEDNASGDIYRIYLSWIENEGWQPTLVELLKEYNEQ